MPLDHDSTGSEQNRGGTGCSGVWEYSVASLRACTARPVTVAIARSLAIEAAKKPPPWR
jgi:hypothetical protein